MWGAVSLLAATLLIVACQATINTYNVSAVISEGSGCSFMASEQIGLSFATETSSFTWQSASSSGVTFQSLQSSPPATAAFDAGTRVVSFSPAVLSAALLFSYTVPKGPLTSTDKKQNKLNWQAISSAYGESVNNVLVKVTLRNVLDLAAVSCSPSASKAILDGSTECQFSSSTSRLCESACVRVPGRSGACAPQIARSCPPSTVAWPVLALLQACRSCVRRLACCNVLACLASFFCSRLPRLSDIGQACSRPAMWPPSCAGARARPGARAHRLG